MYRLADEGLESSPAENNLEVLDDSKLNMNQQCALASKRTNCILGCIRHGIASQLRQGTVPSCSVFVRPHLEFCVNFWAPQYKKDVKILESTQSRAIKIVKDLKYEEHLGSLDLLSLEENEGRPHGGLQISHEGSRGAGTDLSSLSTRTLGNGMNL